MYFCDCLGLTLVERRKHEASDVSSVFERAVLREADERGLALKRLEQTCSNLGSGDIYAARLCNHITNQLGGDSTKNKTRMRQPPDVGVVNVLEDAGVKRLLCGFSLHRKESAHVARAQRCR